MENKKLIHEKRICPTCQKERYMWTDDVKCFECREKDKVLSLGKEVVAEGESRCEDYIICPFCGCDYGTDDMQNSTDVECYDCKNKFHVEVEYSVSYSTSKIKPKEARHSSQP